MKFMITGGAGFIGSAVIRFLLSETEHEVVNVDKLTYSGNLESLVMATTNSRYSFEQSDICDAKALDYILRTHRPDVVMHLAAESHVDRSIDGPDEFINTNIVGTFQLLQAARRYLNGLENKAREMFRFHHISTDEVYGDLKGKDELFTERMPYDPSSPYSASKASSDHLVRAWHRTFDLPVLITNCSNNYGPYQFPEKLIPHMILSAINGKPLPIYGDGSQIRDWLYVDDHARALYTVATTGTVGNTYNVGGHNELRNIDVVYGICDLLEEMAPHKPAGVSAYRDLITFVKDRPGHDARYAIDASKIANELGWLPTERFETGLRKTVKWYLDNPNWWGRVLSGQYRLERIGESQ